MLHLSGALITNVISFISIIISMLWLINKPDYEPLLALISSFVTYISSYIFVLRDHTKHGKVLGTCLITTRIPNPEKVYVSAIENIINEKKSDNELENIVTNVLTNYFKILGILKTNKRNYSERSISYLKILIQCIKNEIYYLGDWEVEGSNNDDSNRISLFLETFEKYRIEQSGGVLHSDSVRKKKSSLIVIKKEVDHQDMLLMRWSDAWGGYFWFIGGIQEDFDDDEEMCAIRELKEEINLNRSAIQTLNQILKVKDKRISGRQHVLTDYEYSIFSICIDETIFEINKILANEFETNLSTIGGYSVSQRCKWFSWEEIYNNESLRKDAGNILDAIQEYGIEKIPNTIRGKKET